MLEPSKKKTRVFFLDESVRKDLPLPILFQILVIHCDTNTRLRHKVRHINRGNHCFKVLGVSITLTNSKGYS